MWEKQAKQQAILNWHTWMARCIKANKDLKADKFEPNGNTGFSIMGAPDCLGEGRKRKDKFGKS